MGGGKSERGENKHQTKKEEEKNSKYKTSPEGKGQRVTLRNLAGIKPQRMVPQKKKRAGGFGTGRRLQVERFYTPCVVKKKQI